MATRAQAIAARCRDCAGTGQATRACEFTDCDLWRFRLGPEDKAAVGKRVTRQKAIRYHCKWCTKDQTVEIRLCPAIECSLYPYRGSGAA